MNETMKPARSRAARKGASPAATGESPGTHGAELVRDVVADTPDEAATLAFEEKRLASSGVYEDDPALHEVGKSGRVFEPFVESYGAESENISDRIAAARSGVVQPPRLERVFEAPVIEDGVRPYAPLPGERPDEIAMMVVETSNRVQSRSSEVLNDQDEIDALVGSNRKRLNATFDWSRERVRGERHIFTRHYYARGVLVDRFRDVERLTQIEVADKAAAIEAYNATCDDPHGKIGYLALLAEAIPTDAQIADVLVRKIVIAFPVGAVPEAHPFGREFDTNVQAVVPRGSARIGVKNLRGFEALYYHDVMKGVYTVHIGSDSVTGRSIAEVDALANALITKARENTSAIDETVVAEPIAT